MPGYNGDKPEPIFPPSPLLPFKSCKAAEVRCVGWLSTAGICVMQFPMFTLLLTAVLCMQRHFMRVIYHKVILELVQKLTICALTDPPQCTEGSHPSMQRCALFSQCMTQHFSVRAGAHLRLFARNSASIPPPLLLLLTIDEKGVNHFLSSSQI